MDHSRRELLQLARLTVAGWVDDRASSMGAAIAYYTAFSIAPLLLIVIAVAGLVFGEDAARGAVMGQINDLIGWNGAQAVQSVLAASHSRGGSIVSAAIGALTLVIGATTVFNELQQDLDLIWKVPPHGAGVVGMVKARLLSFGLVVGLGFLLLVSLVVSAGLSAFGALVGQSFPGEELLFQFLNMSVSFAAIACAFAVIYKVLPRTGVRWSEVWIGGVFTALLFTLGKFLIGLYIGRAALGSSFGAAGAFVVLLAWIYYSAQIFLLGAEFTYQHACMKRRAGGQLNAPSQTAPAAKL